ncbi:MAG: addiction module protein [Actinomycetota bacterium]
MNAQLLEQAAKLSVNERIELVEAIWNTVYESQNELPLTAAHFALLEQHLTAYLENPQVGSPWEEVRARLERLTGRVRHHPAGGRT